ncbi:anti-sigma factor family protein [Microvirga guangxiensis]|uniref:Transmembrane transcriptional regulator (Anti-sigma factor RsiW) n=1 Tax=Microvirga guangxiensis TaxID=549386 RepID=A0A1G5JHD1_9HYPH|nr:anti-sigma factor [Microvirga guangxiensis]SCY87138.1 Transmembrane transcriptional regulator (anti-sigma factor RsiW) [Microvirga guangxiensis]
MTGARPIGEDDLQAYADGRLEAARLETVKDYLSSNPGVAQRVEREMAQREALRARLAFKMQEPIPARLRVANLISARKRPALFKMKGVAAALAWLVLGGILGAAGGAWWSERSSSQMAVADSAITAHRLYVSERLHPVEVPGEQEAHLVQWLSRRVGKPLKAPDLNAQGYRLIGGRLLPSGSEAAALFMYENEGGNRLTLFARSSLEEKETAFRFEMQDGISAFSWIDNGLSYVVSARADRTQLLPIAEAIYHQFQTASGPVKGRL